MILDLKQTFYKDLDKLKNPSIAKRLLLTVENLKTATTIQEISHLRKLESYDDYYRIRIGEYRLGIKIVENIIFIMRFKHRKDIYKVFPPR